MRGRRRGREEVKKKGSLFLHESTSSISLSQFPEYNLGRHQKLPLLSLITAQSLHLCVILFLMPLGNLGLCQSGEPCHTPLVSPGGLWQVLTIPLNTSYKCFSMTGPHCSSGAKGLQELSLPLMSYLLMSYLLMSFNHDQLVGSFLSGNPASLLHTFFF